MSRQTRTQRGRPRKPRECAYRNCKQVFIPTTSHQVYCCKEHKRLENYKRENERETVFERYLPPVDRPFSYNTDLMIVVAAIENEPLSVLAKCTRRTLKAVVKRFGELKASGEYDRIKARIEMNRRQTAHEYAIRLRSSLMDNRLLDSVGRL